MGESRFWRVMAVLALLVAAAYVTRPVWSSLVNPKSAEADGGASAGDLIAIGSVNQNRDNLWLVDTSKKVICFYEDRGSSFGLKFARNYAMDVQIPTELRYNANGYSYPAIKGILDTLPKQP